MGSTKTRELLAIDHNYRIDNQLHSLVLMPEANNRDGEGIVRSRDGGERKVDYLLYSYTNILDLFLTELFSEECIPSIILIDEAQFLTKEQVMQLATIVDQYNIPVMAFGLKNDFQNNLFTGSEALLLYADKIEEVRTICRRCSKKATMVFRMIDDTPIFEGDQLQIGGNESYQPVCRKCYMKELNEKKECL